MKSFIKSHPYLSCAALSVVTNSIVGLIIGGSLRKVCAFAIFSTIFTTLPSIGITAIDSYVHKHLFDSKPIQYGLTAIESVLFLPTAKFIRYNSNEFSEFFKDLVSFKQTQSTAEPGSNEHILAKALTAATLIQSLGFKYIFDLANEEHQFEATELNNIELDNSGDMTFEENLIPTEF